MAAEKMDMSLDDIIAGKFYFYLIIINFSVADPDPGFGACLTPGSGIGKKSGSGSWMNNPDHIS
jgi:hypothetical protein